MQWSLDTWLKPVKENPGAKIEEKVTKANLTEKR